MEAIAPPAVCIACIGMHEAESICETTSEQASHLLSLLVGEPGVAAVALRILDVDLLVRHVHVAADDHWLSLVQIVQIGLEVTLPLHAIFQAAQAVLAVRRIDANQIQAVHLQRQHSSLVVMLFDADTLRHTERRVACVDGCARVALLLGIVPVGGVTGIGEVELSLLHLGLLKAEEVGIQRCEYFVEILSHHGSQAVYVPTDESHDR